MTAISLWRTIKQIFLISLSDEVSTCTKFRLADFQNTGNQYLSILEFLQMAEDICVPWSNKSMVQKFNIEYNVQTFPELENKLTYHITIINNI